jgi:hypothetical protein
MLRGNWMKVACVAGLLLAGGCSRLPAMPDSLRLMPGSGTIHVEVPGAVPSPDPVRFQGRPVNLAVRDFADARPGTPGRGVGKISATVRDMHATELSIDQDVAPLLGRRQGPTCCRGFPRRAGRRGGGIQSGSGDQALFARHRRAR